MGGTGVARSSLLKFIANVLLGNDINHYNLDILERLPGEGDPVGQTALPHLYEIMSVGGTLVSTRFFNEVRMHNLLTRFVFSTRLGWTAFTISNKPRPIRRVL